LGVEENNREEDQLVALAGKEGIVYISNGEQQLCRSALSNYKPTMK
jgi:hypothetical protein